MKNILMVLYGCDPFSANPVGAIRMMRFAKYLIRLGYKITMITPQKPAGKKGEPKGVRWIETPCARENSLIVGLRNRLNPQLEMNWYYSVKNKIEKEDLLKDVEVDVIISSSPPESAHLIGCWLKERLKKPWIADLRDLWSQDHYRSFGPLRSGLIKRWEEKGTLKKADKIITVSEEWGELLRTEYGDRVSIIANGFDEELHSAVQETAQNKFRVTYLGKLNGEHQNIAPFLDAIRELIDNGEIPRERFEADFYVSGYGKPNIAGMANTHGLAGIVKERSPVPFKDAIKEMKNSGLLLLVGWKGLSAAGWRPQKVYEYIGSGTPILLVNGSENKELREFLLSTKSGSVADNPSKIKEEIRRYYDNFTEKGSGEIRQDKNLREYSAFNLTKKLCAIIEEAQAMMDFQDLVEETENKARDLQPWPGYYKLRAKEMESLFSMYRPRSLERTLDIGSGIGFNAYLLNKIYGETFAIDLYEEDPKTHSLGIEKTKRFLEVVSCKGVGVIPGDCEHLPFRNGYFDTVYMFYTLEHIKNRAVALKEISRVLKPEGEAVIIVPNFLERFLYPLSFYRDFFKKAALYLKKKTSKENKGLYPSNAACPVRHSYTTAVSNGASGGKKPFMERFFSIYPHFPFPEPHGEYADYFKELGASVSFAWSGLVKRNNFRIKDMFTTMLIPKEFSSLFMGERALDFYIRTARINRKLGKNAVFKHLGQNLCLVLEKKDV